MYVYLSPRRRWIFMGLCVYYQCQAFVLPHISIVRRNSVSIRTMNCYFCVIAIQSIIWFWFCFCCCYFIRLAVEADTRVVRIFSLLKKCWIWTCQMGTTDADASAFVSMNFCIDSFCADVWIWFGMYVCMSTQKIWYNIRKVLRKTDAQTVCRSIERI